MNGVDAKNLFNGKTTSNVTSSRIVNATGVSTSSALGTLPIQISASIYLAIGESIPSPPQESIAEVRVNTSMYDAQQGSTSGAHIDISTASGTNNIHGSAYLHRGTNWLNADPYFNNADPNIPANEKNPSLHRYTAGGVVGLPIVKDKLFFFGSYQHTRATDEQIGIYRPVVPRGLDASNCPGGVRSATCLATVGNINNLSSALELEDDSTINPTIGTNPGDIIPIAYTSFNYGCLQNCIIPWANPNALSMNSSNSALLEAFPENSSEPGTGFFLLDRAVANLDWNPNSTHSFAAKYYYQHDPTTAPYAFSSIQGFPQHLDAGSQVVALSHTQILKNNLSITETFGFIREKAYSTIVQPFNQARIASPGNPLCGPTPTCANPAGSQFAQSYTYGFNVQSQPPIFFNSNPLGLTDVNGHTGENMVATSEGGNVDLRVPYIGYAGESEAYTAEGVSAYNALQAHVEKRISHGLQAGVSYTFSRSFDEQSAMGLFYNGSNPLQLRGGYAPSDFDRTHVFNVDYHYELPKFFGPSTWEGRVADGWAVQGLIVFQSAQPFSVIDYSGAVGSIFYSINVGITNPIVPLAPGCTPQSAITGAIGNTPGSPALNASCFTIPLIDPNNPPAGIPAGAIPAGDTFETNFIPNGGQRNIFRQSWQKRADISIVKSTAITERFTVRYSFDVFNLTNHPSFDIPIDNINQNLTFSQTPTTGQPSVPSASACAASNSPFIGNNFFQCPVGIGQVVHTIGSARQIQMSLSLQF
jgi:hypothetical protein